MCEHTPKQVAWADVWAGTRPFDDNDPLAHRGPTRITLKAATAGHLAFQEGVGANETDLVLELHPTRPNVARGVREWAVTPGITRRIEIAACLDAEDHLHVARVLSTSGNGIQSQHEEDFVLLTRVPPPPPAPPPPAGFDVLADAQSPSALAVGATDVVWANESHDVPVKHAIRAVARAGGGAVRELATGLENVRAIAVRGEDVYFAEYGALRIARVPLAGGAVETVIDNVSALHLAFAGDLILWSDAMNDVFVRPLAGGEARLLRQGESAVDIAGLATDGAYVYVAVRPYDLDKPGFVVRVPIRGGAGVTIAHDAVCGEVLAASGSVFWATCDAKIVRAGADGVHVLARDQQDVDGIAVAGRDVVFVLGNGRAELHAVPIGGGAVRMVIEGDFYPEHVVVDPDDPSTIYVDDIGASFDVSQGRIGRVKL
jgi:hypothetical protein